MLDGFSSVQFRGSVQFSCSVVPDSLRPHESQHARPPCPSPAPGVHPNPCPFCRWCHPAISSSVVPFSSCPQSFPASGLDGYLGEFWLTNKLDLQILLKGDSFICRVLTVLHSTHFRCNYIFICVIIWPWAPWEQVPTGTVHNKCLLMHVWHLVLEMGRLAGKGEKRYLIQETEDH